LINTAEKNRMTVLQIVPKLEPGGAERSAIEIAEALVAAGHRAIIVAKPGRWSAWAARVGAELIPLNLGRKNPLVLLSALKLRRLLIKLRPDIVHTRSRLPSWLTWLTLKSLPKPQRPHWATTVHGLHSVSRYSAIQHAGSLAIAVSQTAKDYVLKHYPKVQSNDLTVIERGADTRIFYPKQNTVAWQAELNAQFPNLLGKPMLLLAGRGTRLKGHSEALHLLANLRQRGIAATLFFAGIVEAERNAYLTEIKQLCRELDLAEVTVFSESRTDLPALYAHAALVLQLSNRPESFGRTVAEALLCGARVLGFDHGGVGEQLRAAFPAGLAPLGGNIELTDCAVSLLQVENDFAADLTKVPTLTQMQGKTLTHYQSLLNR
jgi:glycosyltransferase involved in cell wall biosynthesis